MSYHFLNECEGNKEIIIEDNCVRLKYKHRSEEKEYLINYSDVKSLSLLRYESVYLLNIEIEQKNATNPFQFAEGDLGGVSSVI